MVWLDEGGDILEMSSYITNEMREIKEYASYCQSIGRRKALETGVLWFFSLAILVVLRLSLNSTYSSMLTQPVFIVSVCLLALLFTASIYLMVDKVTAIDVRRTENV